MQPGPSSNSALDDSTGTGPPAPPGGVPLRRRDGDRVWLGVCAAVGRATGTDPVLWRVAVAVLAVFGGGGLLLYLAGWLLIPRQGQDASIVEQRLRRLPLTRTPLVALVLGAAALVSLFTVEGNGVAPLLAVGLLAFLLVRRPHGDAARPPVTDTGRRGGLVTGPGVPGPDVTGPDAPQYGTPDDLLPVAAPAPPVPRPPVFLLTASAGLLAVGLLLALGAVGALDVTAGRVLAVALLAVGAGHLVALRWGRSRRLVALELLLAVALGLTVAGGATGSLSAGSRHWVVKDSVVPGGTERGLGAGDAVLDLGQLTPDSGPQRVTARVGLGDLTVQLPAGLHVEVVMRVAAGQVVLDDGSISGRRVRQTRTYGPPGAPLVRVDARVGAGRLEVLHG